MEETENLGKTAYVIIDSKILSTRATSVRKEIHHNTGSDQHGKFMPAKVEYKIENKWYSSDKVYFSKEEIIKSL